MANEPQFQGINVEFDAVTPTTLQGINVEFDAVATTSGLLNIKLSSIFSNKPIKIKIDGSFVQKAMKVMVAGVWV